MPYRQPLTPWIRHVADPYDLPVLAVGERGPNRVLRAQPIASDEHSIVLKSSMSDGPDLLIELYAEGEGVIRVRLAPGARTEPRSSAAIRLVTSKCFREAKLHVRTDGATLAAGPVQAEIEFDPWKLRFFDSSGKVLVEENTDESDISGRLRILPLGRSCGEDAEPIAYHETFAARPDEHFFGLGEKFTELDKRGQRIVSWNYDAFSSESERAYKNIPFYLSTRGYGILVNSGMATEFDICYSTHSCVQIVVPDDLLEYYVIAGPVPGQVLKRYYRLTGWPVTPPRWALGTWISTGYTVIDQEHTLDQARRIREHDIPCDVLHLDAYWQQPQCWSDMRWDNARFPDPHSMLCSLRKLGFRVCLWINPYVSEYSPLFKVGVANNYFMTREDGSVYVADVWHGAKPSCGIVDFTYPEAAKWFQDLLRPLLEQGVSVFKTDFGEGVPVDAVTADRMRGDAVHNVYSLLFNDAVADVTQQVAGHRVVWARSSFTGGQRHCAQWAGDNNATWSAMASTLRGGLSYAFSGVPYWSHDVGGFTGIPAPDLMVRSSQFGAFSPMTRFHGTGTRFPWDFEQAVDQAVVTAIRLRYMLLPYLYSAAAEVCQSGLPIMRPLAFRAPSEPGAWSADAEYLLGPDLLVAPMTTSDGERHLYLPSGEWVDFWTGQMHTGGRHIRVRKPLEQMPLFVRANALIATAEPERSAAEQPIDEITLACWGDGDAETSLLSEHGVTRIRIQHQGASAQVLTEGPVSVEGVEFPLVARTNSPSEVMVNGHNYVRGHDGLWSSTGLRASPRLSALRTE